MLFSLTSRASGVVFTGSFLHVTCCASARPNSRMRYVAISVPGGANASDAAEGARTVQDSPKPAQRHSGLTARYVRVVPPIYRLGETAVPAEVASECLFAGEVRCANSFHSRFGRVSSTARR